MSMKTQSLGSAGSAVAGILITGGTNATPIVATITAGHGLKNGDRIAIAGVTGLTAMNGEWTLSGVTATTAILDGSVGNGTFGGTAIVGVVMDKTPFMQGHTAVLNYGDSALVGTVFLESFANFTDFAASDNETGGANLPIISDITYTSTVGNATTPASSSRAFTAGTAYPVEVRLGHIMKFRCSAFTSGVVRGVLTA
jgi:hypothetical protein